jgi:hypothetical protein
MNDTVEKVESAAGIVPVPIGKNGAPPRKKLPQGQH